MELSFVRKRLQRNVNGKTTASDTTRKTMRPVGLQIQGNSCETPPPQELSPTRDATASASSTIGGMVAATATHATVNLTHRGHRTTRLQNEPLMLVVITGTRQRPRCSQTS
jgi:hypothetical protein